MSAGIVDRSGIIFSTQCDVITVTVNCEGVMGAGIALEAKLRWPEIFEPYQRACSEGRLRPGQLFWWPEEQGSRHVLCFPTKDQWRQPSRLRFISEGLSTLAAEYQPRGVQSIAMPHLGCSHGGLHWSEVRPLIVDALSPCRNLSVELWEFDPRADDPLYDELKSVVGSGSPSELSQLMDLPLRGVQALIRAVQSPHVHSLSGLQDMTGIGEKTLQKVYNYLLRRGSGGNIQPGLF